MDSIYVSRNGLGLAQFQIDFFAVDVVDDEGGKESERMVLIRGLAVRCDPDLVELDT